MDIKKWVHTWQKAGVALEKVKRQEAQSVHTSEAIRSFHSLFVHANRQLPPRLTSGLVEMQKHFSKLRLK